MSINSIANAAVARRPDMGIPDTTPRDFRQIAQAARVMSAPVSTGPARPREVVGAAAKMPTGPTAPSSPAGAPSTPVGAHEPAASISAVDTTFNVLFGYIPTEVVTLYVAVVAALASVPAPAQMVAFAGFAVATPIVVWLVFAAKLRGANKPLPIAYGAWPVWEMIAATIAFCAWAVALPESPLETTVLEGGLKGVLVLVTSTILGLLSPIFQRPLNE